MHRCQADGDPAERDATPRCPLRPRHHVRRRRTRRRRYLRTPGSKIVSSGRAFEGCRLHRLRKTSIEVALYQGMTFSRAARDSTVELRAPEAAEKLNRKELCNNGTASAGQKHHEMSVAFSPCKPESELLCIGHDFQSCRSRLDCRTQGFRGRGKTQSEGAL
jgi:hypothetical protein